MYLKGSRAPQLSVAGWLSGQRSPASYLQIDQGKPISSISSITVEVQPYEF
jgi:hypothetical protein